MGTKFQVWKNRICLGCGMNMAVHLTLSVGILDNIFVQIPLVDHTRHFLSKDRVTRVEARAASTQNPKK